jgi:hypothetical protein
MRISARGAYRPCWANVTGRSGFTRFTLRSGGPVGGVAQLDDLGGRDVEGDGLFDHLQGDVVGDGVEVHLVDVALIVQLDGRGRRSVEAHGPFAQVEGDGLVVQPQ